MVLLWVGRAHVTPSHFRIQADRAAAPKTAHQCSRGTESPGASPTKDQTVWLRSDTSFVFKTLWLELVKGPIQLQGPGRAMHPYPH